MEANRTVLQAIALRRCLEATYNRMAVKLAPHILYTRHDDLFIDAVTVERDGKPPRETRLGTFKLDGLRGIAVAETVFQPVSAFNPDDPKYRDGTLFAV